MQSEYTLSFNGLPVAAKDSVFDNIMTQRIIRSVGEDIKAVVGTPPVITVEESTSDESIRAFYRRWRNMLDEHIEKHSPEPMAIPDWLRPAMRSKGMTDDQIDRMVITSMRMGENGSTATIDYREG